MTEYLAALWILMTAQTLIMFLPLTLMVMKGAAKMSGWCCLNDVSVTCVTGGGGGTSVSF